MADRMELRVIDDDGVLGRALGQVRRDGDELTYSGSTIVRDILASLASRRRVEPVAAFDLMYADPWSNGKLALMPARQLLNRTPAERAAMRERWAKLRNERQYTRDEDGKFARHGALKTALEEMGGQLAAYDFGDKEGDQRYADFSSRNEENETYRFELGDSDGEVVVTTLHKSELKTLSNEMAMSIMRRDSMQPDAAESKQSALLASMISGKDIGTGGQFADVGDDDDYENGRYFDFSYVEDREQQWRVEIGSDDGTVQVGMTNEEFDALYASIALTLVTDYPDG